MKTKRSQHKDTPPSEPGFGLGGILGGVSDLLEKLNQLAETGTEIRRTGTFQRPGKPIQGIYGFTVNVGLGDDATPHVAPFGNIRKDRQTGETVVQEIREPVVDLFEEKDHLLIVAEMPGIGARDVRLEVHDDVLTITASKGEKKYRKELLLPGSYPKKDMRVSCNNGVLEIKCVR